MGSLFWVSILSDIEAAFKRNDIPTTFQELKGKRNYY